jgi:hypothetical protein
MNGNEWEGIKGVVAGCSVVARMMGGASGERKERLRRRYGGTTRKEKDEVEW